MFLTLALLKNPLFAPCLRHTIKLASTLELRMQSIAKGLVKKRIELVWANKTICPQDQFFQNNPEWWTETAIIYAQPSIKTGGK